MPSKLLIAALFCLSVLAIAGPASAQGMISEKARQKATFYNAPRQIQIIDERPVIHDFREAPQAAPMMQLPPGPGAYPGGAGGAGGQGQMMNGGALPYRTPVNPMGALPKSGFGQFSNIPARGMGPQQALPNGTTSGGHVALPKQAAAPVASRSMLPGAGGARPAAAARPAAPVAAAGYGGNYTRTTGATGGGSSVSSNVSGRLMNRLKN